MALFNYSYYIICFSFWYKILCSSGCLKLAMYLKWAMYSIFHFWCAWDYSPYVCFLINTYLMLCHASDKTWYCWLKNNHKTNIIKNLKFLKKNPTIWWILFNSILTNANQFCAQSIQNQLQTVQLTWKINIKKTIA